MPCAHGMRTWCVCVFCAQKTHQKRACVEVSLSHDLAVARNAFGRHAECVIVVALHDSCGYEEGVHKIDKSEVECPPCHVSALAQNLIKKKGRVHMIHVRSAYVDACFSPQAGVVHKVCKVFELVACVWLKRSQCFKQECNDAKDAKSDYIKGVLVVEGVVEGVAVETFVMLAPMKLFIPVLCFVGKAQAPGRMQAYVKEKSRCSFGRNESACECFDECALHMLITPGIKAVCWYGGHKAFA